MSSVAFEEYFEVGRTSESDIAMWLRSRNNGVLPVYEILKKEGLGPRFFGSIADNQERLYVAPDMLVFGGNGKAIFVEAKHKTVFTWHRITSRWVTGIDIRHYNDYQRIRAETGLPVWLMFLHVSEVPDARDLYQGCPHQCPTGLYGGELEKLSKLENHRHKNWGRSGMVYWAAESLNKLAQLSEFPRYARIASTYDAARPQLELEASDYDQPPKEWDVILAKLKAENAKRNAALCERAAFNEGQAHH